jgi:phosphopantothenoylcysteine synthetase/decarboxylase
MALPTSGERSVNDPFLDRRVLLGVTGGIAAYKACEIASRLTRRGA